MAAIRGFKLAGTSGAVAYDSEEGRALLQERLAFYGKVVAVLSYGFFVLLNASYFLDPSYRLHEIITAPGNQLHLAASTIAALLWGSASRGKLAARLLDVLDAAGTVLMALAFTLMTSTAPASANPELVALLILMALSMFRAVTLPSSALRTAWITAVAGAPVVAVAYYIHGDASLPRGSHKDAFVALYTAMWWVVMIAVCTVASRVIYGLRKTAQEAQQLGQYTLAEKIGEGGMGAVFKASHAMLRRPTAIKLLPPDKAGAANLLRFEREVQLTARLTHPNTVSIFDYGRTPDGTFYYAMEYLDGIDLEELVRFDGPQPPGRVVRILEQVAGALSEAHEIGLIHRDIKPANMILCVRGGVHDVVKVLDFGLVQELGKDTDEALGAANMLTGTPLYMSPESIASPDKVDARSDLYALGAVGYYLLTGTTVFDGKTLVEVCSQHMHVLPQPPSARLGVTIPAGLEALILSCLEKEPSQRPASAAVVHDRLARLGAEIVWPADAAAAWWVERGREARGRSSTLPKSISPNMRQTAYETTLNVVFTGREPEDR